MFGTHPRHVKGLLQLHLLEPASLAETIEFCHTGAELKKLLKERGLKVSGRKALQAQRLIEADPEAMHRFSAEHRILRCSPVASEAVQAWLDQQAQAFDSATDELIAALRSRKFKRPSRLRMLGRRRGSRRPFIQRRKR